MADSSSRVQEDRHDCCVAGGFEPATVVAIENRPVANPAPSGAPSSEASATSGVVPKSPSCLEFIGRLRRGDARRRSAFCTRRCGRTPRSDFRAAGHEAAQAPVLLPGLHLALNDGTLLFDDQVEVWTHGPVVAGLCADEKHDRPITDAQPLSAAAVVRDGRRTASTQQAGEGASARRLPSRRADSAIARRGSTRPLTLHQRRPNASDRPLLERSRVETSANRGPTSSKRSFAATSPANSNATPSLRSECSMGRTWPV